MITYKMISSNNLLFFIKEAELNLKNKFLSYENKYEEFFNMYNFEQIVGEDDIGFDKFLNNEDINI